jgi:anti-sigma factor (TIGR02949 family)
MVPNRFTCEEVFARLDDFLDRELTAEETRRVQEHLEACAVCAREYGFEATVLDAVRRKVRRIGVPPDLVARITQRLREAEAEERRAAGALDDLPPAT